MKYSSASFIYLFAFMSILGVFNSCETSNKSPKAYFEIWDTTRIGDKLYLVKGEDEQFYGLFYKYMDSAVVDRNGQASFRFSTDRNEFFKTVYYEERDQRTFDYFEYLAVSPGDTLFYYKNGRDSIWAEGGLADQILYREELKNKVYTSKWRNVQMHFLGWPLDSFKRELFNRTERLNSFADSFKISHKTNPKFIAFQKAHTKLWEGYYYARYVDMHTYYAGMDYRYLFADSVGLDFQSYLTIDRYPFDYYYRETLNALVKDKLERVRIGLPDSLKYGNRLTMMSNIVRGSLDSIPHDLALARLASEFYHYLYEDNFYEEADSILRYFESNHFSLVYLDYYKKELARYKRIEPGAPAPDFSLPDTAGNLVTLSDFEGKVVYINFWGTWCWPCIQSIPDHIALHDTFKNTDEVVFLNVSMEYDEEDIEHWKEFIQEKDFFGENVVNVVGQRQTRDPRYEPYGIRAAPTYVLIDRQGRIAKPRADYPTNAIDDIRKLLAEES